MRSVRVRRCRAKHDVLFIPQLVTHLFVAFLCCFLFLFLFFFWLLLLLSLSLWLLLLLLLLLCCCCCFCNTSYCLCGIYKSSHRWCLRIFWHSRSKQHCKYRCFLRLGSPRPRYLRCFFASGSKNIGIYGVFVPVPSKNTGIYAGFMMLQDIVSTWKGQTHGILRYYESQLSSMAQLLIANEVRMGSLGGGGWKHGQFWGTSPPNWGGLRGRFCAILRLMYQVALGWRWGSIPPWSVLRRALGETGMEGKMMEKPSETMEKQWKIEGMEG